MEWDDLCALLMQARDSLDMQVGRPHRGWLVSQRAEWTQEAEEALSHFANHGEWPALASAPVRYQLWIRMLFGLDWMLMNADAAMPVPASLAGGDLPKAFLETVVNDWHSEGAAWLILRFSSAKGEPWGG